MCPKRANNFWFELPQGTLELPERGRDEKIERIQTVPIWLENPPGDVGFRGLSSPGMVDLRRPPGTVGRTVIAEGPDYLRG
jgi:hypothetical protein